MGLAPEAGEEKVVTFDLRGHGHPDLAAYERYMAGDLVDLEYPGEAIERAAARTRG